MERIDAAWLVMLLIGAGAAVIAFLLKRAVAQHDECLDEHGRAITALRVDVAKTQSDGLALAEQLRVLRHDVRDVKHGVDGIANNIIQLLGKGK